MIRIKVVIFWPLILKWFRAQLQKPPYPSFGDDTFWHNISEVHFLLLKLSLRNQINVCFWLLNRPKWQPQKSIRFPFVVYHLVQQLQKVFLLIVKSLSVIIHPPPWKQISFFEGMLPCGTISMISNYL